MAPKAGPAPRSGRFAGREVRGRIGDSMGRLWRILKTAVSGFLANDALSQVTHATGTAERRASEKMLKVKAKEAGRRITVGEDKAYDTADHVANLRALNVTPHVAQYNSASNRGRQSAIDGRTTRHKGVGMSQTRRAMAECIFGWGKQHGTMRKTRHRGIVRVAADFMLNLIAYNLIRIPKLIAA